MSKYLRNTILVKKERELDDGMFADKKVKL